MTTDFISRNINEWTYHECKNTKGHLHVDFTQVTMLILNDVFVFHAVKLWHFLCLLSFHLVYNVWVSRVDRTCQEVDHKVDDQQ